MPTYTLITHVPTYLGQSAGVVRLTESFYHDVVAQAAALRAVGFELTLATPRQAEPDERTIERNRFVDWRPDEHGVHYVALPSFKTLAQFTTAKVRLKSAILLAAHGAAVVQTGAGGHPMALGQFAWPLINPTKSKRIFVFAGDPLPARQKHVTSGRNPAKVLGKRLALRTFTAFCRQAVREADLTFAHDTAVQKRFSRDWNDRCHTFAASPIGDVDLATASDRAARDVRVQDPGRPLRCVAVASKGVTAGVEHITRAIDKVRRLGVNVTLELSDASSLHAAFDAADVFLAAPLVPGENSSIYLAAARGLPILAYRAGETDTAVEAAGGALLVDRGETDRLSQALLDLARDRPKVSRIAVAARAWAGEMTRDSVHRQRAHLMRTAVGS